MKEEIVKEFKRNSTLDHLNVLKSLNEIPFPVGKNLLIDFLSGDYKNKSIIKNNLEELHNFDSLSFLSKDEIKKIIDNLINNKLIDLENTSFNKYVKVLSINQKGRQELLNPTLQDKKLKNKFSLDTNSEITEKDKETFKELDFFLGKFNDQQKKAIISNKEKILCLAGAGSGKTTVLTKRIEFLIKYKSINPEKILAITFTRKAKQEMESRLAILGIHTNVETFNSFCEKILKRYESKIYNRRIRVQSYQDKFLAISMALDMLGLDMKTAIERYFTISQQKNKTQTQLSNLLMNDCFSVLEYFKIKNQPLTDFSEEVEFENRENARMIFQIAEYLKKHMDIQGLRDYTDQVIDAKKFLTEYSEYVPQYDYILIDEYQDVNAMQIDLLNILNPKNLFAVGDPRQSIFGWRGSDINFILNFQKDYSEAEVISLTKNYRSNNHIVNLMNKSIKELSLPDLEHYKQGEKQIELLEFENETLEFNFVIKKILSSSIPRERIFILARTNRQLSELSKTMKDNQINHIVKSDETKGSIEAREGQATLATIHAIKGLEADMVFVIGANEQNFPCKASDHPVLEMIKIQDYDKEEEEKRLFYVAISRAKDILYITHTGKKPTYFITDEMKNIINNMPEAQEDIPVNQLLLEKLKSWRTLQAKEQQLPPYCIFPDKTLEEISKKSPKTLEHLELIKGIGPAKIEKYGNEIIEIVKEF